MFYYLSTLFFTKLISLAKGYSALRPVVTVPLTGGAVTSFTFDFKVHSREYVRYAMPAHVLPWLPAAPPPQRPQNLYKKVHGRCDCIERLWVGLSKQFPVLAISVSQPCVFSHACF